MIMECVVAGLGLFLRYLPYMDMPGTTEALPFDPLGLTRPIPIASEKEIKGLIAVARMIVEAYIACNDIAFKPSQVTWAQGCTFNDNVFDSLERRKENVGCVIEALVDPNTRIIGVYGSSDARKATLLERVSRRVKRDNLFDLVLTVTVTKKSDIKRIQERIADVLGLKLQKKSVANRAISLCDGIKKKGRVLVILCDLLKGFDLGKVGIPLGTDDTGTKILFPLGTVDTGTKILLTSNREEVLSNQMHTQKNFSV